MIKISGNTFQHRDLLRAINAKWNHDEKCWLVRSITPSDLERLQSTVGIVVSKEEKPTLAPFSYQRSQSSKNNNVSKIYGNDETYFNYFKDQNPLAFFGFSNLIDFSDYVKAIPIEVQKQNRDDRNKGWSTDEPIWFGTPNMNSALNLASNGWKEGIEAAEEIIQEITTDHASSKKRINSLAGGQVSVGRMLSGNPKHMKKKTKQPKKRIVTLFVESFISSGVKSIHAIVRAATICAISDLLEQKGYSCEIVSVMTNLKPQSRTTGAQCAIVLKSSNEHLNLSDVAFSLGHPSYFRRMIFAAMGSSIECRSIWSSMGYPTSAFDQTHTVKNNEFYIRQLNLADSINLGKLGNLKELSKAMLPLIKPLNLPIEIK